MKFEENLSALLIRSLWFLHWIFCWKLSFLLYKSFPSFLAHGSLMVSWELLTVTRLKKDRLWSSFYQNSLTNTTRDHISLGINAEVKAKNWNKKKETKVRIRLGKPKIMNNILYADSWWLMSQRLRWCGLAETLP